MYLESEIDLGGLNAIAPSVENGTVGCSLYKNGLR